MAELKEIENTGVFSLSVFRKKYLLVGSGGAGVLIYNVENGGEESARHKSWTLLPTSSTSLHRTRKTSFGSARERYFDDETFGTGWRSWRLLHFGYDNGLAGSRNKFRTAYYLGKDKYFGMIDGVYEYNDLRNAGWHSFGLHLTDVEIFNGQYPIREYGEPGNDFFKIPQNPGLPSDKNYITFRFNRADKRYPKSCSLPIHTPEL